MGSWSVDAEGVAGTLTGVDSVGPDFEAAHRKITEAAESGSVLSVEGRRVVSAAWDGFLEERSRVPGRVMHRVAVAARGLSDATVAVVAGDVEMADDIERAQRVALAEWGIDTPEANDLRQGSIEDDF